MKLKSSYCTLICPLLFFTSLNIFAQHDPIKSLHEDLATDTTIIMKSHSVFLGAGYGNNMIYLGSTISRNMPYLFGSLAYSYKHELSASLSAVHLNTINPFAAFYVGAVNYNHVISSWFDVSANINRYQITKSLSDTLFNSFTYTDLTLGIDWRLLYSKISIGGLFYEENRAYIQFRNSRYFQTSDFLKGKANISFDPYFNTIFSSLILIKSSTKTLYTFSTPGKKWKMKNNPSTTYTSVSKKFGLIEFDFGLPVSLNTDLMTIEFEPLYVIPAVNNTDYPKSKGFVFTLTAFFRIL